MRILYDSKKLCHKNPFGTLIPGQNCALSIHVPQDVGATRVECLIRMDGTWDERIIPLTAAETKGPYVIYSGSFSLETTG